MTAHDNAVNLENNVNTRDQRNAGIWLIVLIILFVAFLYALGLGHAPSRQSEAGQPVEPLSANSPASQTSDEPNFSVNQPVGEVEIPGTVGQPQRFLSGHGNTPVPSTGGQAGGSSSAGSTAAGTSSATPSPSTNTTTGGAAPSTSSGGASH